MADVQIKMVLTGAYAGRTCILGGREFRNGVTVLRGDALNLSHAVRYLGRSYQAFPEGSDELKQAQERDRASGSTDNLQEAAGDSSAEEAQRVAESSGEQAPEAGEAANGEAGDHPETPDSESAGDVSEGSGQPDAGDDSESSELDPTDPMVKAVLSLDPANDEHWTGQGKPAMSAVEKAFGSADITRADVDKAMPDWDRAKATELAEVKAQEDGAGDLSDLM